jgi:hypothetical protein
LCGITPRIPHPKDLAKPKSDEGKARSAMRGYKGGTRAVLRELGRALREQAERLKRIG